MSRKLSGSQWWNEAAPERLTAALHLPAGTSRAAAVDHALARIAAVPLDVDDENLRAILAHCEVFFERGSGSTFATSVFYGLLQRANTGRGPMRSAPPTIA